jgi:hypothetical protein
MIGLQMVAAAARAIAQVDVQPTLGIQDEVILLTEIEQVDPGEGCGVKTSYYYAGASDRCRISVRARVVQVLNDPRHQGLATGDFQAEILPRSRLSEPALGRYIWTGVGVAPGDRFVIFSRAGLDPPAMFEAPSGLSLVTADDEAVPDLELILASSSLSLREQAARAAEALTSGSRPRSPYFAQYAATLVCQGSDAETEALAEAIERSKPPAFSDSAKRGLLWSLSNWVRTSREPTRTVLHVLAAEVARFLAAAPDQPSPGEVDIRDSIVKNYVPLIIASGRARDAFRSALTQQLAAELLVKAAALEGDKRFLPNEVSRLRALVIDSVNPQQRQDPHL